MTLSELIGRLEAATEGSRELDALIYAERSKIGHFGMSDDAIKRAEYYAPAYTTSLDAKLPWENIVMVVRLEDETGHYWNATHSNNNGMSIQRIARTEPLARRIAALKALEDK